MDSSKVFIDTDAEITFIIEKILASKSEKVLLVVPDRAALLTSITGLKILKAVIDKSNKLLILVTLDLAGAELAKRAEVTVVSRIGEVNDQLWEKVQAEKFELMKKSSRTHYVPEDEEESQESPKSLPVVKHKASVKAEEKKVNLPEILDKSSTISPSFLASEKVVNTQPRTPSEVSQVHLNLDELKDKTVEEVKGLAERGFILDNDKLSDVKEENPLLNDESSNKGDKPAFLKKIFKGKNSKDETAIDLHKEAVVVSADNYLPEQNNEEEPEEEVSIRIRKTAPRKSGITNLSFAVGVDIGEKKKEPEE